MGELADRLERSLTNVTPTPEQIDRIEALREAGKHYARAIDGYTKPSREQSLAATHLEDSVMWAVKSIVLE